VTAQSSALRETSLHAVHAALGASMTDFAGWSMPLRYGSELAEHRAVRTAAGLFDLGHMGQIDVAGPQAAAALDYALVGELSAVRVGKARYSMLCAADGGVLDDLVAYRLADDRYLVVANASNAGVVVEALRARAGAFDAAVSLRADAGLIAVQGPSSPGIVAAAIGETVDGLGYYAQRDALVRAAGGAPVLLARTGYTGEEGFELFCAGPDAPAIWAALLSLGAAAGLIPAGLACRDTLRLEAGMALYGHELSADRTPFEAGLGRVVKLQKPGDFVGKQALLARSADVRQTLVGLRASGRRVPRAGYAVLAPGGERVGEVTSGAPSPTLGYPIAMAYVDVAHAEVGATLAIDVRGTAEPATVVQRPFYAGPPK
jgi:aminomethyltransferase